MQWYMIHTGHFGYPQPENDSKLPLTYDYSDGCPTCAIGKVQYAPIRFRQEPKITNKAFTGLNWIFDEIFLTKTTRKVLEDNGIIGMSYSRPVVHSTGKPLENWFQMHPETVLPPVIRLDGLKTETCELTSDEKTLRFMAEKNPDGLRAPHCGRIKYNPPTDKDWVVHYELKASVMKDRPDVVRACEWIGSGGSAHREIFASQRFKDVCDDYSLRGLFYHPVKLV